MKVICVRSASYIDKTVKPPEIPVIGNTYTVVDWGYCPKGTVYYRLEEMPEDISYSASLFAPTSDIDETAFERDYNKVLV